MTNRPTNKTTSVRLLDAEATAALKAELGSEVVLPGDTNYEAARRIWNGLIDKHCVRSGSLLVIA